MVGTEIIKFGKGIVLEKEEYLQIIDKIPEQNKFVFTLIYLLSNVVSRILWMLFVNKLIAMLQL